MDILQGNQHNNPEDFYKSLKKKLEDYHDFPEEYLFKFIIPTNQEKMTSIYRVFDGIKFTLGNRESRNRKYTTCNINAFVLNADQVVNIYKKVAKIEDVILL